MKNLSIKLPLAVGALMLCSTAVFAQSIETNVQSFSANVSGALQGDTGFLTGGQVQVNGVGQGAVVLTRGQANIGVSSGATAGLTASGGGFNDLIPTSSSRMVTTFEFDRDVDTAAALVGVGNVVAQGESIGGTGVVGSSTANSERSGTGTTAGGDPMSGTASAPTSAQGSLVGSFSTQNTIQLLGQGSLFAGAQALDIGETNLGIAAGVTGDVDANTTSIDFDGLAPVLTAGSLGVDDALGGGALFVSQSTLNNSTIDMNVASAGQGSVLVSGSTGGFFGQGTTFGASANPTFSDVGGFFD